jgi:hypothetical protein
MFWTTDRTSALREVTRWVAELGYAVATIPVPAVHGVRWALDPADNCTLDLLGGHPKDERYQILFARFDAAPREGLCRWQDRWAGRLWRANRTFRGMLIGMGPDTLVVTVPYPDGRADRPGLRHITVLRGRTTQLDVDRLERLRLLPTDIEAETLTARLADDLDLRHVSDSFFAAFREAHATLSRGVRCPGLDTADRETVALVTLNRLLFLYFVQRKGFLGGRQDFLRTQVEACRMAGRRLYEDLLQPLFFGLLNTPDDRRDAEAAAQFGVAIPYLNGGLFEPSAIERAHPQLSLDDDAIDAVFVNLLERYSFTTSEDGAGAGIDPEMLGRVFESLMDAQTRGKSGTFYTPRALVDRMIREGLEEVFGGWELSQEAASELLAGDASRLDPLRAADLRARLLDITILDPACGSGAFLLGALHTLERVHEGLWAVCNPGRPAPSFRRLVVQRNLHGIDRSAMAVHLCELRLWLSILDDAPAGDSVEPLPNLDHRIAQGDALLSPLDWCTHGGDFQALSEELREVTALVSDYAAAGAQSKAPARARLYDAHRQLSARLLDRALARNTCAREGLRGALEGKDLFGQPIAGVRIREELRRLDQEHQRLTELADRAEREGESTSFSASVQFAGVMRDGGFHLIVGNPPWVRIHGIPAGTRAQLRRGFESLRNCAWTAGGLLAATKGFASQPDLSVCFVEQSVRWLRRGGVLSMLVPSKLGRALYGAGIRRLLAASAPPRTLIELGSDYFRGATTYPMGLVATRGRGPVPVRVHSDLVGPGQLIPPEALPLVPGDTGAPWLLCGDRAQLHGPDTAALGSVDGLDLRRGFMTGCNEAFALEEEQSYPGHEVRILRGADVGPFAFQTPRRMLWTHDLDSCAPLPGLPPDVEAHLAPNAERLARRNGLRVNDPYWRVLRTGPHLYGHKVAWRDIGPTLQAVAVPPCVDGVPVVPLNTVYFIPVPTRDQALVLAALFNSAPVRAWVNQVAERASGGYRRYFAWVLSLLPVPRALAAACVAREDQWAQFVAQTPSVWVLLELSRCGHHGDADPQRVDEAVLELYRPTARPRRSPMRSRARMTPPASKASTGS